MTRQPNLLSLIGAQNCFGLMGLGTGCWFALIVKQATVMRANKTIAQARIAQPKPTRVQSRLNIIENTTPPTLEPVDKIPNAVPRRRWNQPEITLSAETETCEPQSERPMLWRNLQGWRMAETPIALNTPWQRMIWRYVFEKDSITSPKTWRNVPARSRWLGPYLSYSAPTMGP